MRTKKLITYFLIFMLVITLLPAAFAKPPEGKGDGNSGNNGNNGGGPPGDFPGGGATGGNFPDGGNNNNGGSGIFLLFLAPFKMPANRVSVSINPPTKVTHDRQVTLKLDGGPDAVKMVISNFPNLQGAGQENYAATKKWDLCSRAGGIITFPTCPNSTYTVYAKFYNRYGKSSPIVSTSIKLINTLNENKLAKIRNPHQLATAIRLTQIQLIDSLKQLITLLKERIKLLSNS